MVDRISVKNFQTGLMSSPNCEGCGRDCVVVYDSHHDEYFSLSCGKVIMSMGVFVIPYFDNLDKIFQKYDERFAKRQKEIKAKEEARKKRESSMKSW